LNKELDFSAGQDCSVDGFLMKRTRTIRTAPMSCEKGSMKKRRKKYQDHMKTHLVLLEFNDQEEFVPLCVAECKNAKCKNCSDLREGMAQTLSYGLSLCHKHRLTNEVFLLVISPFAIQLVYFCFATLW